MFYQEPKIENIPTPSPARRVLNKVTVGRVVKALLVLAIIGWGIYTNLDEDAIKTNNEGIASFDSGKSNDAIRQFQEAANSAVTNDTKINALKNLGYAYISEGKNDLALNSFRDALALAKSDSFDYYLISGEIAVLEHKPDAAERNYTKAYQMSPDDFQINNALNLFYLDLEEIAPDYADYPKALIHAQKAYDVSSAEIKNTATQNLGIAHFFNEN